MLLMEKQQQEPSILTIVACSTTMKMAFLLYRTQSILDIERGLKEIFKVSSHLSPYNQNKLVPKLIKEIVQLFAPML